MKQKLLILFLAFFSLMSFTTVMHQDHVKVNTSTSTVKWKGSKVTSFHEGNIKLSSGKLIFDHGKLVGGEFEIDMSTIVNTDMEGRMKQRLEWHLKNEDFFNVAEFPTSTITITNAVKGEGNTYKVVADLTIKGITHPISFDADVNVNGLNFLAAAKIKIDRTKWDIKYNSGNFFKDLGDKLILDEIEFDIFLLSVK